MKHPRLRTLVTCALCCWALWQTDARASTQTVFLNALNASTSVPTPLAADDVLFVDTAVRGQSGALLQSVTFTVAQGVTGVSGRATWAISTATGPGPRLIGVNFDLFNAGNALVLSDTFAGTLSGAANSSFASTALAPGTYTLRASGTGVREAVYDLALEFTGTPPSVPADETGTLPLQGASITQRTAFFTNLQDARTISLPLISRETLLVDTLVTSQTGALAHTVTFTPTAGIDRVAADLVWMTSEATGAGPRLIGLNVDLLDAGGTLIASDTFSGTLAGFAHSTLNTPIGSGAHRIVVTGTGSRDASMGIALSVVDDDGIFTSSFEG